MNVKPPEVPYPFPDPPHHVIVVENPLYRERVGTRSRIKVACVFFVIFMMFVSVLAYLASRED